MHTSTRNRIEFLQKHINKHAPLWFKKYGENLTSIQVHKKHTKRRKKNYYAIVFHVVQKKKINELDPKEIIPRYIDIRFPDRKIRKVRTDVKQTGEFRFHAAILDTVQDIPTGERGTLGFFVRDRLENIFAVTNYHVAARDLMRHKIYSYDAANGGPRYDVLVAGRKGELFKGLFDAQRDVAFVSLGPIAVNNRLPDGRVIDNRDFIHGPHGTSLRGQRVKICLRSYEGTLNVTVTDNSAPCHSRFMEFIDMITVKSCADNGDSGGVVLLNDQVLGIILGSDEDATYIVPYQKIYNFLSYPIL